jgi:hypothetical protein
VQRRQQSILPRIGFGSRSTFGRCTGGLMAFLCLHFGLHSCLLLGGCETYRIEHYDRPQFYYEASEGELVDEWVAPDGTVVKFNSSASASDEAIEKQSVGSKRSVDRDGDGEPDEVEPTPLWEEKEDGTVTMRAFLPQHVLGIFMEALRAERYDDVYDQLLSVDSKRALDGKYQNQGRRAFGKWCKKHRTKLMEMLNRMNFEYMSSDVVLRKLGADGYRIGFTPRLASQFAFGAVDVVYEKGMVKLVSVH